MREQADSTAVGRQVPSTFGTLRAIILVIGGLFFFSLKTIERGNAAQQSRSLNTAPGNSPFIPLPEQRMGS